jgi:O-antigen ligase
MQSIITPETTKKLFSYTLIGLFICFGIDFGAYTFLYSSGLLGGFLLIHHYRNKDFQIEKPFWIAILFLAYVSITPGHPLKDLRLAGMMSAAFFAGLAAYTFYKDALHRFTYFLPLTLVTFFIVHGIAALLFSHPFFDPGKFSGRLILSFSHPNVLGEMASLGILSLLCFPHPKRNMRFAGYGLMIVLGIMIFLTVGRSTYLGITVALLVFALFNFRKKLIGYFAVAIVLLGCATYPFIPESNQTRIVTMLTAPHTDPTFQSRLPLWKAGWDGFKNTPLVGDAFRNFKKYHKKYMAIHYKKLKAKNKYTEKGPISHPHSLYISALYSWGILGVVLLGSMGFIAIRQSLRMGMYLPVYAIVFMLAYGLFDVRFQSKTGDLFLFFPIGMAFSSLLTWKNDPKRFCSPHDRG